MLQRLTPSFAETGATGEPDPRLLLLNITRLAPSSGIQFIDVSLATDRLGLVHRRFVYDTDAAGERTVLIPVPADVPTDGVEYHPVTGKVLEASASRWLSGLDGVRPFLDRWVPVPFFRFIGRDEHGKPILDAGPTNWARVYVASPNDGAGSRDLSSAGHLDAVLAFDTRLETEAPLDDRVYLAPSADDAVLGSTFVLEDRPEALAPLVSEPWLDGWLRAYTNSENAETALDPLDHVARYLTFICVLRRSGRMPAIRFIDTLSPQHQVPILGVDLIINIGNDETSALLVDDEPGGTTAIALEQATTVTLRDLTRPTVVHDKAIPTVVEFDDQTFGDGHASRLSGRRDAFQWPSVVRIGGEAEALARRANATPGVTGLAALRGRLTETAANASVWRFSRDDAEAASTGRIVSGRALDHLGEDGRVLGPGSSTSLPAMRPRFSNSSILGLFIGELLTHAIAQINAPSHAARLDKAVRTRGLNRVIVTCPAATPDEERELLRLRAENAVDLVWRGSGWSKADAVGAPRRPDVSLGLDIDLASQFIYLFDEIRGRFAGDATEFIALTRRPRPGRRTTPSLRIASIDASSQGTHSAILGYNLGRDGAITPALEHAGQSGVGADAILAAVIDKHIVAAISQHLTAAGMGDSAAFLADALGEWHLSSIIDDQYFARRFRRKILVPAANALIRWYRQHPAEGAAGLRRLKLEALHPLQSAPLRGLASSLEAAAVRAGATGFQLDAVTMALRVRDIEATIEGITAPLLDRLAADIGARECDLVLLNGPLSALPVFERGLRQRLAMAPWRLINMHQRSYALLNAPLSAGDAGPRAWLTGAVGAWLASRHEVTGGQFSLLTGSMPVHGVTDQSADGSMPMENSLGMSEPGRRLQLVSPRGSANPTAAPAMPPSRPRTGVP